VVRRRLENARRKCFIDLLATSAVSETFCAYDSAADRGGSTRTNLPPPGASRGETPDAYSSTFTDVDLWRTPGQRITWSRSRSHRLAGLNAAMLHRWVKEAERSGRPIAIRATVPSVAIESGESFVPVALPSNPAEGTIRIEVRRRGGTVSVEWPASAAHECARLLRELMMIRVDAVWFAVEPFDMRAGVDKALARVVSVFGVARAHHAYLFINKRANRMKVLVHDGFGLWLYARKLYEGSVQPRFP